MSVTSDDVARLAGVSRATVSYVVNNGPRPVSEETRARVLAAIQELGYHPNEIARNLRLQRTSTLGLIVPDTHNPYFSEVAQGIEAVAFERGYTVVLCHSSSRLERELQYVDMLTAQRVAGVIWIPGTADFAPYRKLTQFNIKTVVIDRLITDDLIPAVIADNQRGGYLATEHLIQFGHRRIGYIGRGTDLSHSRGRFEGYRAALSDYHLELDERLVFLGAISLGDGHETARHMLDLPNPPTAIFAYSDTVAIGALRGIYDSGLRVPRDFSLVGFDNIAQAAYTCPALTTIHLPKSEMGQRGAELLIALIEKRRPSKKLLSPLPVELIVRESSGPAPQDGESPISDTQHDKDGQLIHFSHS
jgi:LacI family transcriptional regulator